MSSFDGPHEPPLFRINLSLPPRIRHREICKTYAREIGSLTALYDEVLSLTPFPRVLKFLAKRMLRRVFCKEESEEIRGIAEETGVGVHLVVAYNTFLDLFSGCISGGAKVSGSGRQSKSFVHFRGLDWDMEQLRDIIIRVEYVRDGVVVARGVTYAGYVGVLTGVRKGLSISFNYRARLASASSPFAHRLHHLLLLLGRRPSIPSTLRHILLAPTPSPSLAHLAQTLPSTLSSPGYITFCTPDEVLVIEKDLKTATIITSSDFLAVTNHDQVMESWSHERWVEVLKDEGLPSMGGMRDILEESVERKECVAKMWRTATRASGDGVPTNPDAIIRVQDVKKWLTTEPVVNEMTHFSCIMDPAEDGGGLLWVRAYDRDSIDSD